MKYLLLIFLFTTVGLSEIIHRNYRKDGVKEFQILKYIKGNKCDCSCKCNPQNQLKLFVDSTTSMPMTTSFLKQDEVTKKEKNINLGDILSTNGKRKKMKTIDVSAETNIVTNDVMELTTTNPIISSFKESSDINILKKFEETPLTTTTVGSTAFLEKFTTTKVNEEEIKLTENIDTSSFLPTDEMNVLTTAIMPMLTDNLTTVLDQESTTTFVDIKSTKNPVIATQLNTIKSNQIDEEKRNSSKYSLSSILSTTDNTVLSSTEFNVLDESIGATEEIQTTGTPHILDFDLTTQSETVNLERENETELSKTTTFIDGTSTKIKEIAENESTDIFSEETTISPEKNKLKDDKISVKIFDDMITTTQMTLDTKEKNDTETLFEKPIIVNELGLNVSNSNNTSSEDDIPEAEFSDTEKSEHISSRILNTTLNIENSEITTQTPELEKTTLPIINIDLNHITNNIITTTTIQTTTENESEEVAFKIEETEDKSLEEATEVLDSTTITTSIIVESITKEIETFKAFEVLQKIDIVTEKVDKLDSLDNQLTKEIYNLVSEIRSKFENTSMSLKIEENDQRLIQVKWSKLINKLREKLAKLQTKKINNEETLSTVDFILPNSTTPSITIFSKKFKEQTKTDFSINENSDEEKVVNSINTLENRLEEAKNLREKQEKAEDEEKVSIEKTLDALAEKERFLREQADRKRLHFTSNHLNKARTINDINLIRQPIRRGPDPEEIDDSIKLPQIQCEPVRNFIKIFKITDPKSWIQENCQFVKQYFPSASCVQIKDILISCL